MQGQRNKFQARRNKKQASRNKKQIQRNKKQITILMFSIGYGESREDERHFRHDPEEEQCKRRDKAESAQNYRRGPPCDNRDQGTQNAGHSPRRESCLGYGDRRGASQGEAIPNPSCHACRTPDHSWGRDRRLLSSDPRSERLSVPLVRTALQDGAEVPRCSVAAARIDHLQE
jgi:hypothetical protein